MKKSNMYSMLLVMASLGALQMPDASFAANPADYPFTVCAGGGGRPLGLVTNRFDTNLLLARGFPASDMVENEFSDSLVPFLDAVNIPKLDAFLEASGVKKDVEKAGFAASRIACFSFKTKAQANAFRTLMSDRSDGRRLVRIKIGR